MKNKLHNSILRTIALFITCIITTSSVNTVYAPYDNDIDECQKAPCPEGYICINIPNGFICKDPETGEGMVFQDKYYETIKKSCEFRAKIDAKGYVTLWGKKLYVGTNLEGEWVQVYEDAQIDCKFGGEYICKPVTCLDFWMKL